MIPTIHHLSTMIPLDATNPIDGMVPNFNAFGVKFDAAWKKILGGIWAVVILLSIGELLFGFLGMAQNRGGTHPAALRESRTKAIHAAIAIGLEFALTVIVGMIIALVS